MTKSKKLLLTALSVALVAVIAIFGTVAYLMDTDSDVNVMTLGNVEIAQHEYQRATDENGDYETATIDSDESYVLEPFEQAKPLYPTTESTNHGAGPWDDTAVKMTQVDSYGSVQVFKSKNAQDKIVTVENTGKSDAYVRNLVAIEVGTGNADLVGISSRCVDADEAANNTAPWVSNTIGRITIGNNQYLLFEYVYRGASDVSRHVNGVLPAGETTYPSLCQVYLDSEATNADVEALDGNKNGMFDILVLSQAVQTEGFADAKTALDTAFGKTADKAAEWFGDMDDPVIVNNAEELQAALDAATDGTTIILAKEGNYGTPIIRVNEGSELVDYYYVMSNYGTNYYGEAGWQYAKRTINNLTITGVKGAVIDSLTTSDARDDAGNAKGTRNNMFEINNLKISNITVANGITFNVSNVQVGISETETTTVPHIKLNGLTIENCKTTTGGDTASNPGRKLLGIANTGSVSNAKNIVVTNCTVTDMYQGVYIVDGENVRVEGNNFSNLTHNAIHINSLCSGNILIANNTIANVAERPIRFNKVVSGTVIIKDNAITNSGDTAGELFKASGMGVGVTWENNTIDGVAIELTTDDTDIIGKKQAD